MARRLLPLVLVLPGLLANASFAASTDGYMVGTWFGRGQPGDRLSMYIDRMAADGRWRGEYRTCVKGRPLDQVQTGRWMLEGDRLSLHVETVDGKPRPRTDRYRMVTHAEREQKYLSLPSGFAYTPRRVDDAFHMPPCDLIS